MKRVIIVCEGPTEQAFCKTNLLLHMQQKGILIHMPLIKRSKGGIVKWSVLKEQIEIHLKSEPGAWVTTFIDYYGVHAKHGFPDWETCEAIADKNDRMTAMEEAMHDNLDEVLRHRFIPYLQLHEFEGLLFNDINVFYSQVPPGDIINRAELEQTFAAYGNPEMINNNRDSSPSHRLQRIIQGYNKVVYGDILSDAIGLVRIRNKSPRFHQWITKLEGV